MKKITIYILLMTISTASFSQSIPTNLSPVRTDYLQKSHHQKTAAWVLLGGGGLMASIGSIISAKDVTNNLVNLFDPNYQQSSNTGPVLMVLGTVTMLGSVPLFIASSRNKRKAMTLSTSFKLEKIPVIFQKSLVQNSYPALSLKINL